MPKFSGMEGRISRFFTPDFGSTLAFEVLIGLLLAAWLWAIGYANRRIGGSAKKRTFKVSFGTWVVLCLFSLIVQSGWIEAKPMPRMMMAFGAINFTFVALAFSRVGGWLASGLPLAALVGFQMFRLPLELILHSWAAQGSIPQTMTWSGSNFDIITGVLALLSAPFVNKSRIIAWGFNSIGFLLLLNVMRVVVLSSPLPFAWEVDPPLLLIFHLPYAWIGPVCVGGALFGHLVTFRALLRNSIG